MTADDVAAEICNRGGYELVGLVGAGAFKFTFHVRERGQPRALKLYQKGVSERSEREIEAMMKCDHPNIAKFIGIDSITIDGVDYPYLLEEFLSGGSLTERLGKLDAGDIAHLALFLSQAIEHIASHQLVHRDLKPDNVMFRDTSIRAPVIVDFGLVRDLTAASLTESYAMSGPGTAFFAAPEQLNNEKGMITSRTDQFGLGITLAFALFQSHPYAKDGDGPGEAIQRVANWENPSSRFVEECRCADLAQLIPMVQPYPVQRYRSGGDLIAAWRERVRP